MDCSYTYNLLVQPIYEALSEYRTNYIITEYTVPTDQSK